MPVTLSPQPARHWHRRVWALAVPIILSNLSVPLVGAVDTAVVGHLPDPVYIGAVALGAVIFNFLYWGFGFLRMGTTGFVAQAFGAGDSIEVRATLARAVLIGVLLGVVLIAVQSPLLHLALWAFEGSERLESLAADYYRIRIWSAPATLVHYALLGTLIGVQNTRAALALQLVLNGTNVVLDLVFVVGLGWGVEGVAAATLISEFTAAACGVLLLRRALRRLPGSWRRSHLLDASRLRALLRANANIFVRTLCLIFAFSYFTAQGTKLGEAVLAANAVLMHLQQFLAYGLDGFAHAAEALAGGAYGARDRQAFRAAARASTHWALLVALVYLLVYATLGTQLINLFTGIEVVRDEAYAYLPWVVASPLISVWSFQLDGIFIGTTRTREMRNGMLISLAVYLLAVELLLPLWGNHGLWLSLLIFLAARALTLGVFYPRIERSLSPRA